VPTVAPRRGSLVGIRGTVVDAVTGEPLIEALVEVVRGPRRRSARTDLDGRYEMALPPGVYELRVSAELHLGQRLRRVHVTSGRATSLALRLDPDPGAQQEVVVEVQAERRSEEAVLQTRRRATVVADAISAQEIARSPDASASDAAKRMVSATVVGGRYVVIRGLSGRYSATLLNGVVLPSPEPDEHAAPLDLFPAALLSNLTVLKSYSPELPGSFAGGALLLETNTYPSRFESKIKLSLGLDSASSFRDQLTSAGGKLDYFGFDDGTRSLPAAVPRDRPLGAGGSLSPERVNEIAREFQNAWTPSSGRTEPNLGISATVGDTLRPRGRRLGYVVSLGFAHKNSVRRADVAAVRLSEDKVELRERVRHQLGVRSGTLSGLFSLGLEPRPGHDLGLLSLYTHTGDSSAQEVVGFSESDAQAFEANRLQFVSRTLNFTQLSGSHRLPWPAQGELRWQGNFSFTRRDEPDTRDASYNRSAEGEIRFRAGPASGEHLFTGLQDLSGGGGLRLLLPFARWFRAEVGGGAQVSSRGFGARRFRFSFTGSDPAVLYQRAERLFAPEHIGTAFRLEERTLPEDAYDASGLVGGGFAAFELLRFEPLKLLGGLRWEAARQRLSPGSAFAITGAKPEGVDRSDIDLLPAASLVYAYGERGNLRAAYSYTVARPIFRELAPFLYFDFGRRRSVSGNPKLASTRLHNLDLRWEHFPSATEVLSASLFFKRFEDPIEQVIVSAAQGDVSFANAAGANTLGGELEVRLGLGRLWRRLAPFRLLGNFSLIWSRVELGAEVAAVQTSRRRPLQGQSPFVVNLGLTYRRERSGTEVSLLYNAAGRRLLEVGFDRLPDTFEEPFHRLDLSAQQELPRGLQLKLALTNIANQSVTLTQGEFVVQRYSPGVVGVLSLEWAPERAFATRY
jgi:hypothetical protein